MIKSVEVRRVNGSGGAVQSVADILERELDHLIKDWLARVDQQADLTCIPPVSYTHLRKLRINERTLEKWEQGRAKPNPQAAALVLLVRKYPDTLERLEQVAVS